MAESNRTLSASDMRRRLSRRRSLALMIVVCFLIYISGKILVVNRPTDLDEIYQSLSLNMRHLNVQDMRLKVIPQYFVNMRSRIEKVNCAAVFRGNKAEIQGARKLMDGKNYTHTRILENDYIEATKNCDYFKSTRGYNFYEVSLEEKNFPIAYSILLFKDVEQAERLLRALYTPQNLFCLHVDADSESKVHDAIRGIAGCFDNVFVASRKEFIVYAGFTRLQADLNCMENLIHKGKSWKYFINLPSQEFPLKTNAEIVKILNIYNGSNDIEGITGGRRLENRYKFRYVYRRDKNKLKPKVFNTTIKKDLPPNNITVVKGSAYGIFSRDFAQFIMKDKVAREVLEWFRDVLSPDEYYWATLQYNHHIGTPGSFYKGKPDDKPWLAAFAAWGGVNQCHEKFVRGVCVFGLGDLEFLSKRRELFANKFYLDYQPLALDCIEEWHFNKSVNIRLSNLNTSYFAQLPFIGKTKS